MVNTRVKVKTLSKQSQMTVTICQQSKIFHSSLDHEFTSFKYEVVYAKSS